MTTNLDIITKEKKMSISHSIVPNGKAMVTNHSGDRPISSLIGRRWNLGIAQRFLEKSSRL